MLILVALTAATVARAEGLDEPAEFDIPAQGLDSALLAFSEQGKIQVVVSTDAVSGQETEGVEGEHTPREALEQLLASTGLIYSPVGLETVAVSALEDESPGKVQSTPSARLMAQASTNDKTDSAEESTDSSMDEAADRRSHTLEFDAGTGRFEITDEIIVRGSRRNLGIRRSEDDFQPYVVFDKEEIQRSGISDLDDFLRTRLPSNNSLVAEATGFDAQNTSRINLRGLGIDETLILINGRRVPRVFDDGSFQQGDLNGIPISIVERIEILPATAAGIYGGGATGGAINIVLRSDYRGLELGFDYDNTFDVDSAIKEYIATGGFSLNDGKMDVLFSASYQESNQLLVGDRPFARESRTLALANDPDQVVNAGFPPAGATTNVFGLFGPLVLDDGTPLNSDRTFVPYGYAGAATDGGAALLNNAGQYNLDLPNDLGGEGLRRSLLNDPTTYSLSLNVTREFAPWLDIYVDSLYRVNEGNFQVADSAANRFVLIPGDVPNNPFDDFVLTNIPLTGLEGRRASESETIQLAIGFVSDMPKDWALSGDVSWSESNTDFSATPLTTSNLGDAYTMGAVDVFADFNAFMPDYSGFLREQPGRIATAGSELLNLSLRASGPLFKLPGGHVTGSFLVEEISEEVDTGITITANPSGSGAPIQGALAPASQRIRSVYGEFFFPFVGNQNSRHGISLLEATVAARYDRYETEVVTEFVGAFKAFDVGSPVPSFDLSTLNFSGDGLTLGLRYAPINDFTFRMSLATGIKPPTLRELQPVFSPGRFVSAADPQRGNTPSVIGPLDLVLGGNPGLEPEESETLSAGFIFTPRFFSDLRFSLDYVRIEKSGEVSPGLGDQALLDNEALFSSRVVRGPLEPDAPDDFTAGPIQVLDLSAINLESTKVESIDFQIDYRLDTSYLGVFDLNLVATRNLTFERQESPESEIVDSIDFIGGPIKWLGNVRIVWERGRWSAGWIAQYVDSFSVLTVGESVNDSRRQAKLKLQGRDRVPSQWFHDAYIGYQSEALSADVSFTVRNIFDRYEPFPSAFANGYGFAPPLDPRLRSYILSLRKRF